MSTLPSPARHEFKFRLTQFPCSLLYINRADYLWVVAVAHGSRMPAYWKRRVV
jgi:hypothetical protein